MKYYNYPGQLSTQIKKIKIFINFIDRYYYLYIIFYGIMNDGSPILDFNIQIIQYLILYDLILTFYL